MLFLTHIFLRVQKSHDFRTLSEVSQVKFDTQEEWIQIRFSRRHRFSSRWIFTDVFLALTPFTLRPRPVTLSNVSVG